MEKEKKCLEQLRKKLSECQLCGPEKCCKLSVARGPGNTVQHISLTHNMLSAWAGALAIGTHGVTLTTPPRSELFAMFHHKRAAGTSHWESAPGPTNPVTPTTSTNETLLGLLVGQLLGNRSVNTPTVTQQTSGAQNTPQTPSRRGGNDANLLSSSPGTPSFYNPYPTIEFFFQLLGEAVPQRAQALAALAEALAAKDLYNINEIDKITEEDLVGKYKLSEGNAQFVVKQVAKEIKRVRKTTKKRTIDDI
ncbi:hypothetical protein AAF712_016813 [Marasmius tenuissimus]|uniref:Uncharacterized protein n=1 Tax=Marasmius tenuissimus TaxID=585030 RepID=A0ABR2Z4Z7_9AGAR